MHCFIHSSQYALALEIIIIKSIAWRKEGKEREEEVKQLMWVQKAEEWKIQASHLNYSDSKTNVLLHPQVRVLMHFQVEGRLTCKKSFQAYKLMGWRWQIWGSMIEIPEFDFSKNTHKS